MSSSGFTFALESLKYAINVFWGKLSSFNLGFPGFTVGSVILVLFASYSTFRFLIFPALNIDFKGVYATGEAIQEHEVSKKWENRQRIGFY